MFPVADVVATVRYYCAVLGFADQWLWGSRPISAASARARSAFPEWQGRGLGSRIVRALLAIIRRTSADGMLVTLFTGQNLAEFYEQFGFGGLETGLYGMSLRIDRQDR